MNKQKNPTPRPAFTRPHDAPVTAEQMKYMPGREAKEKRTRAGKIYSLGQNLHQAVLFADPVHYRSKATGAWEEIDNTLIPATDAAGGTYLTNRANDEFRVEFHPTTDAVTILMQDDEEHLLGWFLKEAQETVPVRAARPRRVKQEDDLRRDVLAQLEDEAVYQDIFPGVDLRCRVQAMSFKDELIFSSREAVRPVTFVLTAPGLNPEQRENGGIDFVTISGEAVFTLPAPFLKDSAPESVTGGVRCELEPSHEQDIWYLTYTPDEKWMAEAQFPVILDPVVINKKHSTAIEDNFITSAKPTSVQTYNGTGLTVSNNSSNWGTSKAYLKFLDSGLPAIDSSYYITKAYFSVMTKSKPTTAASILLKEVLGAWSSQSITYNNAPALNDKALDYQYMTATGTWYTYDISNLVRKWYSGTNYGLALEAGSHTYLELYSSDHVYNKPYVTIHYVSLAGLEDYLAYEEQEVGRAGVGHVSLYNGNLVFERQDTSCGGSRLPVSISHIYNSCYRNVTAFGAGAGWKMNIQQTLHKETVTDTSGSVTYYVYMDADGTRHHFKQVSGVWKDQSGLGMTLTISGSTATITDKGHNALVFDLPTAEFGNNYANVKMLKTMSDACGNTMTVTASGCIVSNVKDGAGRNTGLGTISNRVDTIFSPGYGESGACGFTYDGSGRLTQVWELAGESGTETMTYTYDGNGLLTSATNCDGVKVTYEYYTAREPFRVKRARITSGTLVGLDRQYEYKDCLTVVTDNLSGKKLFYHFNDYGNVVSVNDELGYACFAKYSDSLPVNHPEAVSKMQRSIVNLLRNHNFEADGSWSTVSYGGTGTYGFATDQKYMGTRSMKVTKTNADGNMCVYMNYDKFTVGKTYTLSAYIRSTGSVYTYATAAFGANWFDGVHVTPGDQWTRISTTLTASATSGTLYFITMGGAGTAWIDCAQLEEGPVANHYNMLINGDFTFNSGAHPTGWLANSSNTTSDIVYATCTGTKPAGLSTNTMRIYGTGRSKTAGIYQDIQQSGSQGDVYVAGGWSFNYSKPRMGENFRYNIRVAFLKAGTSSTRENTPSIEWSEEWTDWQFAAGPVVAPCNYSAIRFNVDYEKNINYAEFGGLFLHKEEFGQTYTYDSKGNILATKNTASLKDGATYDAFDNMLTYFQPGRSASVKTTLEWGSTDAEKKKHLLRKSTSPMGIVNEYTYDSYGNRLTSKTGGSTFMQTKATYTSDGNHVANSYDARNKAVQRAVNQTLDTVTSVTDPRGQSVSYTYDQNRRVKKTSATVGSNTYTNSYTYTKDKLTQVKHNTSSASSGDVAYNFAYDGLGRPTTVKVGTQTLSTTSYNANGTVANVTYGNGGKVVNTYDAFKRVTGVRYDSESTPHFSYTYGAHGEVAQVKDNVRGMTVTSEYDVANRPMRKTTMQGSTHVYTGEVTYDQYNNLSSFKEQVGSGRTAYTTTFTHDNENRPTALNFGGSRSMSYAYDSLGRLSQKTVNAGGTGVTTTYAYLAGGHGTGSTTPLVQKMTQQGKALTYAYDNAGNMTSVNDGSKTESYGYDLLGQLIRANDPYDTTAGSAGTTWVYSYDLGGNMTSRKAYAYTTGTVGTAVQTISYTYGDSNWKDKLTAYNGAGITYDAIGNPTSDGTWTYTWAKGRQLQSMSKSGSSVSYTYNEDGLRVQKNVSGTVTSYILHGKNVVQLTQGSNNLHFFYGADGSPAVVMYNGASYGYVKNLQGDIVSIVNSSGAEVVHYTYDAWGKLLSKTGTLATSLGTLNPFRYRGYVYDEETGLYYLRSRYYNPTWGRFVNGDGQLALTGCSIESNIFAYCGNRPIDQFDDNGAEAKHYLKPAPIIGGIKTTYENYYTYESFMHRMISGGLHRNCQYYWNVAGLLM